MLTAQGDVADAIIKRRPPVASFDSPEAYELARFWLKECSEKHTACFDNSNVPLPSRLIDIGDTNNHPSLFVVPEGTQAYGRYITLSYCWGQSRAVTLNRKRLENSDYIFPLDDLPPTIRDAIKICRKIGFQFIWIDALCIVQDSIGGEDWKVESSKMDRIYGNAALTLAAVAASGSDQGIFSIFHTTAEHSLYPLPFHALNGEIGTVYVGSSLNGNPGPLDSRAWAFQESLLSARIIKYGSSQMSWTCKTISENANGPLRESRSRDPTDWKTIVTDYTHRKMTCNSDRLAALAGYARFLSFKNPQDKYLAGLWSENLLEQILWKRETGPNSQEAHRLNLAPSWSWASIDEAVNFFDSEHQDMQCEIRDVAVAMLLSEPFGRADSSQKNYLSIRGKLKSVLRVENEWEDIFYLQRQSTGKRSVLITLDTSKSLKQILHENGGSTKTIWLLQVTYRCGIVLIAATGVGSSDYPSFRRIGFAEGLHGFDDWFLDPVSGSWGETTLDIL